MAYAARRILKQSATLSAFSASCSRSRHLRSKKGRPRVAPESALALPSSLACYHLNSLPTAHVATNGHTTTNAPRITIFILPPPRTSRHRSCNSDKQDLRLDLPIQRACLRGTIHTLVAPTLRLASSYRRTASLRYT